MTDQSLTHLRIASLHLRQGGASQDMAIRLHHDGDAFTVTYDPDRASLEAAVSLARVRLSIDGITVSEVILEGHAPDLTALHYAASKLLLNVETTSGRLITEPVVKSREDPNQAVYFVPEGWDLADARARLPASFAAARPKVARALDQIEQANKSTGGEISRALEFVALLILETGDPDSVYAKVLRLLHQVSADTTAAQALGETA
ncbi:hypothetical protein J7E97_20905 [Streptomyces sp. ISL-66]|uniref:hypothetical protein n=1 Tax=Streptomyces sp. ISL-66 TaxID=2819186 RepID=UPI001BE5284D|nr:hypothetical protein [Streptomyces sp. ISL-66]MBT2470265.1 hypothetical protein [Streptomyces sp. ISL-66]